MFLFYMYICEVVPNLYFYLLCNKCLFHFTFLSYKIKKYKVLQQHLSFQTVSVHITLLKTIPFKKTMAFIMCKL